LEPGIHFIEWNEFVNEFGYSKHRRRLITGLKMALDDLRSVGCQKVYIDGSFVTKEPYPADFDACWEIDGVDLAKLKRNFPLFFDFANGRANQKNHYKGEMMPARAEAKSNPIVSYLNFFQTDRNDNIKGIIGLVL
jgi:hypothetical protein